MLYAISYYGYVVSRYTISCCGMLYHTVCSNRLHDIISLVHVIAFSTLCSDTAISELALYFGICNMPCQITSYYSLFNYTI